MTTPTPQDRPTEQEWANRIASATWPDGGHDGFPTRRVSEMIAAHLAPLIEREREAAKAEGMTAVAGPVLALAKSWDVEHVAWFDPPRGARIEIERCVTEALARTTGDDQ